MYKWFEEHVPADLAAVSESVQQRLSAAGEQNRQSIAWLEAAIAQNTSLAGQLVRTLLSSEMVLDNLCANPQLFEQLFSGGDMSSSRTPADVSQPLIDQLSTCTEEQHMHRLLRQFRTREMLRIIWRDINRLCTFEQTAADISVLAEVCIQCALDYCHDKAVKVHGEPFGAESGAVQRMVVIGMGKLGAGELNLSSDIDLIFAFPEAGETVGGEKPLSNQEFFTRLGKQLIKALDLRTVDGFVFRVDMRLRPNGESGPLALNFSATEDYYQQHGRDWERYAMVKARPVAGDIEQGQQLLQTLQPFVYRRYIDFGAIESLRDMKRLIEQQVARQNLSHDIKLGSGGIRELEFIVQSFQLVHGGRNTAFRKQNFLQMLSVLGEFDCLTADEVSTLEDAYRFLRNTEHALQAWRDEQTQRLPSQTEAQAALALAMGFPGYDEFSDELAVHRSSVSKVFAGVISPSDADEETLPEDSREHYWQWLWQHCSDAKPWQEIQQEAESEVDPSTYTLLVELKSGHKFAALETVAQDRVDRIIPLLLTEAESHSSPEIVLRRVFTFVESVLRRTAYIALLLENPQVLKLLVRLCSASPWIAEQLVTYPALLDELLNSGVLFHVPSRQELHDELRQQLLRVNAGDLEEMMETLRHFKLAHGLRVAACQLDGSLPLMKVSDYLTYLAEVILQATLDFAWQDMTHRYGVPSRKDGSACNPDFIIVGYGKLGGIELGPASDLDLVFIHDAFDQGETLRSTDEPKPIANAVFFNRLGQRIIHILNTQTVNGELYEVDMRLRPSGASGLLVSSFDAFQKYQQSKAWVWEHQALIRARVVAGDEALREKFEALRATVICQPREKEALRAEVVSMREKMLQQLDSSVDSSNEESDTGQFSLKQGRGGIVDIEFLVQYLILRFAGSDHSLVQWTDNVRLIEQLALSGILTATESEQLVDAYTCFRSEAHSAALRRQSGQVAESDFSTIRQNVVEIWRRYLEDQGK